MVSLPQLVWVVCGAGVVLRSRSAVMIWCHEPSFVLRTLFLLSFELFVFVINMSRIDLWFCFGRVNVGLFVFGCRNILYWFSMGLSWFP